MNFLKYFRIQRDGEGKIFIEKEHSMGRWKRMLKRAAMLAVATAIWGGTVGVLTGCSARDDMVTTDNAESGNEEFKNSESKNLESANEEKTLDYRESSLIQTGNIFRISSVIKKLKEKEEVKIAFLGGSITEGYLVNSKQNYPAKLTAYLKQLYKNENITCINAGLSGTSSSIGLLRADTDVLSSNPDLIVIEFAVNDAQDDISKMMYESLVKKCLQSESAPAVILLFNRLENGYTCEEQMKKVGEAYELPMISMKNAIEYEMENGDLTWNDYAEDEAHPTAKGHEKNVWLIILVLSRHRWKKGLR